MKNSTSRKVRTNKAIPSSGSPLPSSTSPSARPLENEKTAGDRVKPFRFLDLPSELRNKIYEIHFNGAPSILDLDPDNYKLIGAKFPLLLVSKQIHEEASHQFYATHVVRLFPTHPGRFFKTKKPLLARLPPRHRGSITSLQLRLGPGFTNPPRGWVVNDALGLQGATSVRLLVVFVEVDTSDPIFKGFRRDEDGFYERFSQNLLDKVLMFVPSISDVQFDAYPSVRMGGDMMGGLLGIANKHKKLVSWGPERGWNERKEVNWADQTVAEELSVKISSLEISVIS
jgi:hypothetical protein